MKPFTLLFIFIFGPCLIFAQSINYNEHIAPIIKMHCYECHQKGGVAPIPFSNYNEVSSYAAMIAYVTGIRYMPPWKVVHPKGQFKLERGLSAKEIESIKQWVNDGVPEGNSLQNERKADQKQYRIENPDATFCMSEAFEQYGVYYDQFRVFVIPTNLAEDRDIESIAFVPGNPTIMRSCFISIDTSSKCEPLDKWDPQYGYFSFGELGFVPMESRWYNWHPGKTVSHYKNGYGKRLPKNAKLLLHVHYGPTGVPKKDSSFVQLKFAKKPIREPVYTAPLIQLYNMTNDTFLIVPNDSTRIHAKFVVPFDMHLHGLFPQSHLLGRKWEIFTVDPTAGTSEVLLKITDWDFKWKQMYDFQETKLLKKGTIVHALASYDNTTKQLSNPSNPPRSMSWGKRMFEELFVVFFKYSIPALEANLNGMQLHLSQVNLTDQVLKFDFSTTTSATLSARIVSFDAQHEKLIFQNRVFLKGKHPVYARLTTLPKGNYYLELKDQQKEGVVRQLFVYMDDFVFE